MRARSHRWFLVAAIVATIAVGLVWLGFEREVGGAAAEWDGRWAERENPVERLTPTNSISHRLITQAPTGSDPTLPESTGERAYLEFRDAESGAPISAASVQAQFSTSWIDLGVSDDDGLLEYSAREIRQISVQADGFRPRVVWFPEPPESLVTVLLAAAHELRGIVLLPGGAPPPADANVTILASPAWSFPFAADQVRVDARNRGDGAYLLAGLNNRGEYRIEGARPDLEYRITAAGPGLLGNTVMCGAGVRVAPDIELGYLYAARLEFYGPDGQPILHDPNRVTNSHERVSSAIICERPVDDWTAAVDIATGQKLRREEQGSRSFLFRCAHDEFGLRELEYEASFNGYAPFRVAFMPRRFIGGDIATYSYTLEPAGATLGKVKLLALRQAVDWVRPSKAIKPALARIVLEPVEGGLRHEFRTSSFPFGDQVLSGIPTGQYNAWASFANGNEAGLTLRSMGNIRVVGGTTAEIAFEEPDQPLGAVEVRLTTPDGQCHSSTDIRLILGTIGSDGEVTARGLLRYAEPPYFIPGVIPGSHVLVTTVAGIPGGRFVRDVIVEPNDVTVVRIDIGL